MKPSTPNPFLRLWKATFYSLAGLKAAFVHEQAFRLEVYLLPFVTAAAFYLTDVNLDRALLIASWIIVMLMELLNSAIEAVVDRFGGELHELSGRAKDIGSAAVMAALVLAVVIWLGVLVP